MSIHRFSAHACQSKVKEEKPRTFLVNVITGPLFILYFLFIYYYLFFSCNLLRRVNWVSS